MGFTEDRDCNRTTAFEKALSSKNTQVRVSGDGRGLLRRQQQPE
jgi:hypothetical protein